MLTINNNHSIVIYVVTAQVVNKLQKSFSKLFLTSTNGFGKIIKSLARASDECRSLKTEQSFDKQMCRASCFKQEQQYLRSQFASKFWVTNYKLRVWSWLRTNAGGVPNTCKSNEAFFHRMLAFTERSLVANGWVTRRQPAQKRGITLGNRC